MAVSPDTTSPPVENAAGLCRLAGVSEPVSLTRLVGGRNNRVWRVDLRDGESPVLLKEYFRSEDDARDRLGAEWAFLSHAWTCGVRTVPRPLAADPKSATALYSFLPGRRATVEEIDEDAIEAAMDFVVAVNSRAAQLPQASEACVSLNQHLTMVDRRLARLNAIDRGSPLDKDAASLVENHLKPAWERLRVDVFRTARTRGMSADAPLPTRFLCISPSDFGFHNALRSEQGKFSFIDFEYAGLDDPAKLVCDFFCQPEVPVQIGFFDHIVNRLQENFSMDLEFTFRCSILYSVYRIKWSCIVLNEFLPAAASRRHFSAAGTSIERKAEQLERARQFLEFPYRPFAL